MCKVVYMFVTFVCYKKNVITNLIVFTGYFKNDLFGIYKSINLFNNKIDNIIKLFETIDIPDYYKNNFIINHKEFLSSNKKKNSNYSLVKYGLFHQKCEYVIVEYPLDQNIF